MLRKKLRKSHFSERLHLDQIQNDGQHIDEVDWVLQHHACTVL